MNRFPDGLKPRLDDEWRGWLGAHGGQAMAHQEQADHAKEGRLVTVSMQIGMLAGKAMADHEDGQTKRPTRPEPPAVPADLAGNLRGLRQYLWALRRYQDLPGAYEDQAVHENADQALLAYIGDARVTVTFDRLSKWYS